MPERLDYQTKDLKSVDTQKDIDNPDVHFYSTEEAIASKQSGCQAPTTLEINGRASVNPEGKLYQSNLLETYTNSIKRNKKKSLNDDSLYKSPTKLKDKAKNSQII